MGQSLSKNYMHLVFSTKDREPLIQQSIEDDLFAYISGILKNLNSVAIEINSVADHIHILFELSKNYSLAKVVEEVKKSSSKWMKSKGYVNFNWQNGYAAFSVSESRVPATRDYIFNQKEHHQKKSFKKEVEQFLKDYGMTEYKEEFFWR